MSTLNRILTFMSSIVSNGGPSVTRWVFLRTAEVISLGWLGMVGVACYVYFVHQTADVVFIGAILTLGAGLFAFATNAQTTKLAIDAKSTGGNPSSVETSLAGATVTAGESR